MDIFDRITHIVDIECKGDIPSFSRLINIKYETLRGMLKYRRSYPGFEVLHNILANVKWINAAWLMTGEGEAKILTEKEHSQPVIEITPKWFLDRFEELVVENELLKRENGKLRKEKKVNQGGYSMVAEPEEELKRQE